VVAELLRLLDRWRGRAVRLVVVVAGEARALGDALARRFPGLTVRTEAAVPGRPALCATLSPAGDARALLADVRRRLAALAAGLNSLPPGADKTRGEHRP
jgi:hypothetical protein